MNPRYPVYIISKGRWEKRLTARSLEKLDCPEDCLGCEYERDRIQELEEKLLEND